MMRMILLVQSLLFVNLMMAQIVAPTMAELSARYPEYLEKSISQKRFGVEDLIPIFGRLNSQSGIGITLKAHSLQGRPIYLAKYGHGPVPVLFWSQMHGDESTATMALLDLFNYLNSDNPEDQEFLKGIRENLTLYFIPMLNPDGAAKFARRNAAHIDINRDAIHLASPESRLLKEVRDSLDPVFGFNLHDQSIYYRAGREGDQVALAFLAPAFDYAKNINGVRLKSMQLVTILRDSLHQIIPGRLALYDDSFEPRAFGDNIQRWGTSTILIESGGYPGDPEKLYLRKLNFITLIKALESIMNQSYEVKTIAEYNAIPNNDRKMMSLIIRDLDVPIENQWISMDVGYQYAEQQKKGKTIYTASINDVGDLSVYDGFNEFAGKGYKAVAGKWHPRRFSTIDELIQSDWQGMIRQGFLGFIIDDMPDESTRYPFHLATEKPMKRSDPLSLVLAPDHNPTFYLEKEDNKMIVHNGVIFTLEEFFEKFNDL